VKKNNLMRFWALLSLGFAYGIIYLLPYMKSVFYDQMTAATGFSNEQLGLMLSVYAIVCTASYLPGGWIADKFKPRTLLTVCLAANGLLCFLFMFLRTSFFASLIIWMLAGLTGAFAFWPAMLKGVRLLGTRNEQGRIYGIFEALNGGASLIGSLLMVWVSTWFADMIAGFNGAVISMGVLCLLAAAGVWFTFNENITYNEDALEEKDKINWRAFGKTLIMPQVWIPAALLFCGITMYGTMSYLSPYLTDKFLITAVAVSWMSSVREYGCRLGGIGGGFFADKVFKSSAKWQVAAQILTAGLVFSFIFIPTTSPLLAIVIMFVFALAVYANRVTAYSLLSELKVPARVGGTALALVTLIGYIPDMFMHTMFGSWMDASIGADGLVSSEAFNRIFIYAGIVGIIGVLLALVAVFMRARMKKKEALQLKDIAAKA